MQIEYLQTTHDSVIGDIKEIPDLQAAILIKLGIAKVPADNPIVAPELLLNPNGTPVIDDFGSMVLSKSILPESEKPAVASPKSKKRGA